MHVTQSVEFKMTTDIPAEITTPDSVDTRIGILEFFDGMPDAATVQNGLRQPLLHSRCRGFANIIQPRSSGRSSSMTIKLAQDLGAIHVTAKFYVRPTKMT
jgi:hypothetical protein